MMELRPANILLGTALLVGASTVAFPFVDSLGGLGTNLFQIVTVFGFTIAGAITSFSYADTHHAVEWCCSLVPNLIFFLIPALGIYEAAHGRWPARCSIAIVGWCAFYLASVFLALSGDRRSITFTWKN